MRNLKKQQTNEEAEQVSEALLKFVNLKGFFKKFMLLFLMFLFFNNISPNGKIANQHQLMAIGECTAESEQDMYINSVRTKITSQLITEVEKYITKIAPENGLSSGYLVSKCLEYDTDIIFVLSQALLESHFGTKGKAAETNSVWNVGTYDDGQILYKYNDPNESLEPYLKLINEKYLINVTAKGDTIIKDLKHLVQDKGYINYAGHRFASARGYENGMRKLMVKIDMETSISFYQDFLKLDESQILALFDPEQGMENETDYFLAQN